MVSLLVEFLTENCKIAGELLPLMGEISVRRHSEENATGFIENQWVVLVTDSISVCVGGCLCAFHIRSWGQAHPLFRVSAAVPWHDPSLATHCSSLKPV